eukprot:1217273-Heterocapsa_arctica.AAC.1
MLTPRWLARVPHSSSGTPDFPLWKGPPSRAHCSDPSVMFAMVCVARVESSDSPSCSAGVSLGGWSSARNAAGVGRLRLLGWGVTSP